MLGALSFSGARTWRPQGSRSLGHGDVDTDPRVTPSRHRLRLHRTSLDPGMRPTRSDRAKKSSSVVFSLRERAGSGRSLKGHRTSRPRGGVLNMYLFCFVAETRRGTGYNRDRVPSDVRRRNQDARPLRALMRSMRECETRSVHACESPEEDAGGVKQSCPTMMFVALPIYCTRGKRQQAVSDHTAP